MRDRGDVSPCSSSPIEHMDSVKAARCVNHRYTAEGIGLRGEARALGPFSCWSNLECILEEKRGSGPAILPDIAPI